MRKIKTLYQRDPATNLRHVRDEIHPDLVDGFAAATDRWVATYKWNGTAVLVDNDHPLHRLWKRREVKAGKPTPAEFRAAGFDQHTQKWVGWVPADAGDPADKWLLEAIPDDGDALTDGTYELVGPKVQGNPHGFDRHCLIFHGRDVIADVPLGFAELGAWLHNRQAIDSGFEGIVWWDIFAKEPVAKIKVRDFPPEGS